jgi:hypothetical protein
MIAPWWGSPDKEHLGYILMNGFTSVGKWFTMEPGEPIEMEVLIGDFQNPHFGVYLLIQDEEEMSYYNVRETDGMPILPVFRTAEMPASLKRQLKYDMYKDEVDFNGGEIFNVY